MNTHSYNRIYHLIIGICLLFLIYCFNIGCAVEKGKVYTKDGKLYGKTDGLFKASWDDYYLRGLSYSEGSYWADAAADFAVAIQKRGEDQRRARTYGMHFIDYFPNRELGIAYYNMKRYRDAIEALKASLARVESARAKFYLDKARRAWLDETRLDTTAPAIAVDFPPAEYRTRDFSIAVRGTAKDDYFVSNIVFNGRPSHLELSQKEVPFQEEFLLRQGKNVITLHSEDILGKSSSPLTILVKVDREGPLVFLEVDRTGDKAVSVTGAVYDQSPLAKLTLQNRTRAFDGANFTKVEEQFSPTLLKDAVIEFEAEDILGNKTRGSLNSVSNGTPAAFPITDFPRIASRKPFPVAAVKRGADSRSEIDLSGLRDGLTIYLDTLTVEGTVKAGEGIEDLTLNNESLLSLKGDSSGTRFLKLLREKRGRPLAFSKTVQLTEGLNTISATLTDAVGTVSHKEATISRKVPTVRQLNARLSVSIFPFTEKKKTGDNTRNYVHTFLNRSFVDLKRFNVLQRDRLNAVLEQQQISRESVFKDETAVPIGRLMDADTVLIGDINTSGASIEITAHLLDAETASLIAEKDVYWEGDLNAGFRGILDRLALKFKQHIPLCEGSVTETLSPQVVIDLGSDRSIHRGMRFLAYREVDPLIDKQTGMNLGSDTEAFALLSAKEVDQTFSRADIVEKFTDRGVHSGDRVISK
jgi:hypothetical protein